MKTYDVYGYKTQADFDNHKFTVIEESLVLRKDARRVAKDALKDYEVVKVTDHDQFDEVFICPGP